LRERFLAQGAAAASVSGSGSAVFGLFASEESAQAASEQLTGSVPWTAIGPLTQGGGARITA
jgi:4-diphosphocytidyl-2C-methyl-D-erythritol kinase